MKYKVGDTVTIRKNIPFHDANDDIPGFVLGMEIYCGKSYKIKSVYHVNSELFWYKIDGDVFTWCEDYFTQSRLKKLKRVLK